MYQASIPGFVRMLNNLAAILDKAEAHATARKIDPAVLLSCRLYPDMYPLVKQVQIASDNAKGAGARLAGIDPPSFADTETTFPQLQERLRKTNAFLLTLTPAQIDGGEARDIKMVFPSLTLEFKGQGYLLDFALPNIAFHVAMAYAILRHNGVEVGKSDFLGKVG